MATERPKISLMTLGGGVMTEMFDDCLQEVLADIADHNTLSTSPRSIVLEIKFKPNEDRHVSEVEIFKSVKKGKLKPLKTRAFMGLDPDGDPVAFEYNPQQRSLFKNKQLDSNIEVRVNKPTITVVS